MGHTTDPVQQQSVFEDLMARAAGRFARVEPRRRARAFVLVLLAGVPYARVTGGCSSAATGELAFYRCYSAHPVPLTTPAVLAHAFLAAAAAIERAGTTAPPSLAPLTCSEIRHLFAAFVTQPARSLGHQLRCPAWRRRHQARARASHYRRQAAQRS